MGKETKNQDDNDSCSDDFCKYEENRGECNCSKCITREEKRKRKRERRNKQIEKILKESRNKRKRKRNLLEDNSIDDNKNNYTENRNNKNKRRKKNSSNTRRTRDNKDDNNGKENKRGGGNGSDSKNKSDDRENKINNLKNKFSLFIKGNRLVIMKNPNISSGEGSDGISLSSESSSSIKNPYDREGEYDVIIKRDIKSIDDLIELGKIYDPESDKKYNFDVMRLHSLIEPLTELRNLIGMKKVKQNIVNQIVFYLQKLDKNNNMMHTVIEGSPGVGKTTLGKILAKVYLKMGVVERDYFRVVRRTDLVGKYLGETSIKTQEVIDDVRGGVLFIDEAYSLGNPEKRDSFSKECLDCINCNLSDIKENDGKKNFVMIIAGYKDSLKSSFFSYNRGLERRFPFRYEIDDYKGEELYLIFKKVVDESEWIILPNTIDANFFKTNKDYFKYNGGDVEAFFQVCKIAHARRVFCSPLHEKRKLNKEDIKKGLVMFLLNDDIKKRKDDLDDFKRLSFYM